MSTSKTASNPRSLRASARASALGLALSLACASVPASAGPATDAGRVIDNAAITAQVKTRLITDPRTRAFDINVDTSAAGVVTLRGTAPTAASKAAAEEIARSARGVASVHNALVVAPPGSVAERSTPPATASQHVKQAAEEAQETAAEAWITARVTALLAADAEISVRELDVDTEQGVVKLVGSVATESARARAIEIAAGVKGVQRVDVSALRVQG